MALPVEGAGERVGDASDGREIRRRARIDVGHQRIAARQVVRDVLQSRESRDGGVGVEAATAREGRRRAAIPGSVVRLLRTLIAMTIQKTTKHLSKPMSAQAQSNVGALSASICCLPR